MFVILVRQLKGSDLAIVQVDLQLHVTELTGDFAWIASVTESLVWNGYSRTDSLVGSSTPEPIRY